jgi:Zn-dependent protease
MTQSVSFSARVSKQITPDAFLTLQSAQQAALQRHNLYLDVEHLLLALLADESAALEPLKSIWGGRDRASLQADLAQDLGMVRQDSPWKQLDGLTQATQKTLEAAGDLAKRQGVNIHSGHLLWALFESDSPSVQRVLTAAQLDRPQVEGLSQAVTPTAPPDFTPPEPLVITRPASRQTSSARPRPLAPGQYPPIPQAWYYIMAGLAGLFAYLALVDREGLVSFGLVFVGWVFSLTLHEFAHAIVAYWGGDYTVRDKGYLTFNPLRYAHPLLSFALPMIFLALGGIGLPGGAVYIEEGRLRSPWWRTVVSLAGPASNALLAVVFAAPFFLGLIDPDPLIYFDMDFSEGRWESALAFLVFLQITAVFLNLLPIPPLDGFNAISPFLPAETVTMLRNFGLIAIFLLFYLFRIPAFADTFFGNARELMDTLQVPWNMAVDGLRWFRFWN